MLNYRIVRADSAESLEKQVQELLSEGWSLLGGVSVSVAQPNRTMTIVHTETQQVVAQPHFVELWAQAMVRDDGSTCADYMIDHLIRENIG